MICWEQIHRVAQADRAPQAIGPGPVDRRRSLALSRWRSEVRVLPRCPQYMEGYFSIQDNSRSPYCAPEKQNPNSLATVRIHARSVHNHDVVHTDRAPLFRRSQLTNSILPRRGLLSQGALCPTTATLPILGRSTQPLSKRFTARVRPHPTQAFIAAHRVASKPRVFQESLSPLKAIARSIIRNGQHLGATCSGNLLQPPSMYLHSDNQLDRAPA